MNTAGLLKIFRRKEPPKESPMRLLYIPTGDMTPLELSHILRVMGVSALGGYWVTPRDYCGLLDNLGSAARHFVIDEDVEARVRFEEKVSDLIGQPLSMGILAEIMKRMAKEKHA